MSNMRDEIMNIKPDKNHLKDYCELRLYYRQGHIDARYAAAALAISADAEITKLKEIIRSALIETKFISSGLAGFAIRAAPNDDAIEGIFSRLDDLEKLLNQAEDK